MQDSGFRVECAGCTVEGAGIRMQGVGLGVHQPERRECRVQGSGWLRVESVRFMVWGSGLRV